MNLSDWLLTAMAVIFGIYIRQRLASIEERGRHNSASIAALAAHLHVQLEVEVQPNGTISTLTRDVH